MDTKIVINGKFHDQNFADVSKCARNPKNLNFAHVFYILITIFCVFIFLGFFKPMKMELKNHV